MKAHISYLDEENQTRTGWFEIKEQNENYIKFETNNNILTIPIHRILKIKEKKNSVVEK